MRLSTPSLFNIDDSTIPTGPAPTIQTLVFIEEKPRNNFCDLKNILI
jgi:hypothetical protein